MTPTHAAPAGQPAASIDLIETAREHLRQAVLPAVPAERRYDVLMIANALGIAARELAQAQAAPGQAAQAIEAFHAECGRAPAGPASLARLAQDLRAGLLDEPAIDAALRRLLARLTLDRLARSNPKRHAQETAGQGDGS